MSEHDGKEAISPLVITRRRVLQSAVGAAALALTPGLLAACGGSSSTGATSSGASGGTVGGTLDYMGWQGDDFPEVLAPWKKQNQVTLRASYIGKNHDIQAKYAAGGATNVDIIGSSSTGIETQLETDVPLMPLDTSQIPNWNGLTKFFRENELFYDDEENLVAVPYLWGAMGITYDSTQMQAPTSWSDLLDPKFKDKITILDDSLTAFDIAALLHGIDMREATHEDLDMLKAYLTKVVGQTRQTSPSFGDMSNLLASGEVMAAWGGYTALSAFAAEAGNDNITTALDLKEGSASFAETYSIPSTGQNQATAYAMINEILDPATNANAANTLILAPCVDAAWSKVDDTVRPLFPRTQPEIEEFLEHAPLAVNAPIQSADLITLDDVEKAWLEVKEDA